MEETTMNCSKRIIRYTKIYKFSNNSVFQEVVGEANIGRGLLTEIYGYDVGELVLLETEKTITIEDSSIDTISKLETPFAKKVAERYLEVLNNRKVRRSAMLWEVGEKFRQLEYEEIGRAEGQETGFNNAKDIIRLHKKGAPPDVGSALFAIFSPSVRIDYLRLGLMSPHCSTGGTMPSSTISSRILQRCS